MRKHLLIALIILLTTGKMLAQSQSVTGRVTDASTGEPLVGVNVEVKGTKTGTITDIDGNFALNVPSNATLTFIYLGYQNKDLPIEGRKVIEVALTENTRQLDEVVVIGYGTMRRKDLTGAVTQIRPERYMTENPTTIQDILRGTPGLAVSFDATAKGGGTMELRGQRSVYTKDANGNALPDHNSPLIVLDGMIFYGDLSEINPDDIGQIDILKDASAAAIYGAKAASGVIIITTKKGELGKPKVNVISNIGYTMKGVDRKPYGPEGYLQYYEDWNTTPTYGVNPTTGNYEAYASGNIGNTPSNKMPEFYVNPNRLKGVSLDAWRAYTNNAAGISDNEIWARRIGLANKTLDNYLAGKTYNWYDRTFRTGFNQDHNISISGASDKMNYYMSLGYLSNEGIVNYNYFKAVRSIIKVDGEVNKWLSIGANVNFQDRTESDLMNMDNIGGSDMFNWQTSILGNSPYALPYDDNGNLIAHPMRETTGYIGGYNADFDVQYKKLERGTTALNPILSAKIKLPYNITYTFNVSPRYQWYYNRYWQSSQHPNWASTNGMVDRIQQKRFDWSLNNTINWDYTFAKIHHVNVTLAQEAEERQSWQDEIHARDITPTDALGFHRTDNSNPLKTTWKSDDSRETADGMLARLFYSYNDRYMVTGSVRRDGYSAFGTSNPRATFFSAAAAWTFTNEKFFRWEPLNHGKLRLSWGQNGNRLLENPYLALANLLPGNSQQGYINSGNSNYVLYQTLKMDRMANPKLKWEYTEAKNLGLDLSFLKSRFNATAEFYIMNTNDMIMRQTLPGFSGFTNITTNLGQVENKGFEISLNSQNIKTHDFEWSTSFGYSKNKNTIKHLYYQYTATLDDQGNVTGMQEVNDITNKWFIGQPVSAIWDYRVTGIWQASEVDEAKRYGQRPGDPKVANNYTADDKQNADGTTTPVYNDKDKEFLGQTAAPIHWSLRNDFVFFKDFTFTFNIYSNWGAKCLNTNYLNRDNTTAEITNNFNVYMKDYWTPEHPTTEFARLNANGPSTVPAPGKLYDRSFVRLENIALGYSLPRLLTSKWDVEKVKIFASIRNAAVWAKDWKYWDPETYNDGDRYNLKGFAPRTYSVGINIIF